MRKILIFFSVIMIMASCVPVGYVDPSTPETAHKRLIFDNITYEAGIKTVLLYPRTNKLQDVVQPAVVPLSQVNPLVLEFDDLKNEIENFYIKIVHCTATWKNSGINDIEYLYDFNEFPINEYELSFNTRTPFVHYSVLLPKVKLSGNYIVKVYRGKNENDLILTRRFMVYDNLASIGYEVKLSSEVRERRINQQIVLSINYGNLEINNPSDDIKIVIRQNQRWDNAITNLKPTMIREDQKRIDYEHFTTENEFKGGNEFRFFDIRTINFPGQNVGNIDLKEKRIDAFLFKDRSRGGEVYGQYNDINGQYVVGNAETGGRNLEANYVNVHFFLQADAPVAGNVYVAGALTNWKFTPENQMKYDAENKQYYKELLLKQGFYNYAYLVQGGTADPNIFEGSHFETENKYEVFIYTRPVGSRVDLLIGYTTFDYNQRR
ncbi:MAG: DUF5103 domain-containing protein [Bacteroidota bacterium]|nr:DUF5103 domain-containing protein [Bacteroidota bacterium]